MTKRIPTYKDCIEIVESTGKKVFYETKHVVQGYNVSIFNYRLATYSDFINQSSDARELRGLTFVFNEDGSLYKRYLMLRKFWNLNQVTETQYSFVKDWQIQSVYDKADGSMISFVQLPNGNIVPRTKASFGHEMLVDVNKLYSENSKLKRFVEYCLSNDLAPFFEYVSWKNRIVLEYDEPKLILLRLRDNNTGEYTDIERIGAYDLDKAKKENYNTLDEMVSLAEKLEDKEGWVVTFRNGEMIKIKTKWYFEKHRLILDSLQHDATVISMVLDETIDDAVSQLDSVYDKEKIEWVRSIENKIQKYIFEKINNVNLLLENYDDSVEEKSIAIRRFAMKYKKDENFPIAISVIRGGDVFDSTKNFVKRKTDKLEKARKFLEKIK